ncbi:PAS domain S-box protein [Dendronalium sp. ChiSLP03b]|uniref:PAS domain S-box protein n=1 Tax=Dendronalium sp. ChiSLP03b TaxID=3075381 RepID=UPI00391ABC42
MSVEQLEQLQTTLTRMQVTLDAIADAVVWVGEDGCIHWWNSNFATLVNQPHSSIFGSQLNELLPLALAGQPIALSAYPDVKIHNGEYQTTNYELQQGDRTLILQISGSCAGITGDRCQCAVLVIRDITQAQQAQESLRESEERLRTLINATPDIICLKDGKGRWLVSNQANLEFLKLEGVDYQGKTDAELAQFSHFYGETLLYCDKTDEQAWQHGSIYRVEEVIPRLDGTISSVDMIKIPLFHQDGKRKCLVVLGRDISDRKRVEEALQQSELQYRGIFEAITDGLFITDIETEKVVAVNPAACQMHGYSYEEFINLHPSAYIHPNSLHVFLKYLEKTRKSEEFYGEAVDVCKDGTLIDVEVKGTICTYNGKPHILAIVRNISERRRAEAVLREREAQYRDLVETANCIILRWDNNANISFLNDYGQRFFGFDLDEIIGRNVVGTIVPETETSGRDLQWLMVDICQHPENYLFNENENICKNGDRVWIVWANKPVLDEQGNLIEILSVGTDATKRKQAEEALSRSELKYRNIFETSQVGIIRNRKHDGLIIDANQHAACILGYPSATELINKHSTSEFYVNPSDRAQVLAELEAVGEVRNFELPMRRPDGSLVWLLLSLRFNPEESCLDSVFTDITDRKQQEQALRLIIEGTAAKTGDEFFNSCVRYLAEVLQVQYAVVTEFVDETKTRVRSLAFWCGDALGEKVEYSVDGTPCQRSLQGNLCHYPQGLKAAFPEDKYLAKMNAESFFGVPLTNSFGEILGHLAVIDTKPMKHDPGRELIVKIFAARTGAELERKRADEAIQRRAQAESLLSSISRQFVDQDLDTAIDFTLSAIAQFIHAERCCIFELSPETSVVYVVNEWCATSIQPLTSDARSGDLKMFPLMSPILAGKNFVVPRVADLPVDAVERILFDSQSIKSALGVPMIHSDKVVGFIGADIVRYTKNWTQEDINILKLVGEIIAIGRARHQAEEALRVAKEAAETANRAKSAFLANMSHELRTPLNAILGFAQLMERDAALKSNQRESLATINRSGEHLLNLINDVLEMSKIEAGHIVFNPEDFDLHLLLQTLQAMFQVRAGAKQLFLRFDIAADLPRYIQTDEGKLRQVLINLLGNAVKFTQSGGVTLRARLGTEGQGRQGEKSQGGFPSGRTSEGQGDKGTRRVTDLRLIPNPQYPIPSTQSPVPNLQSPAPNTQSLIFEVEDTGRGIAPEEMDNLFQPFVQTSSGIQMKEGTGLGLTISRQFVRLLGGDIRFTSTLGQGSTFSFEVQVTLAEPLAVTPKLAKGRVLKLAADQPPYRVLVVDDRQENRDLILQLLGSVGFEMNSASNGQEAIALWQTWQPHLIWMDMRMPVMNGYEATKEIRARESSTDNLPIPNFRTVIIALTASAFEEQRASILSAGCDDLVRKPFREQVIFEKIAEHLPVRYLYAQENCEDEIDNKQENLDSSILDMRAIAHMPTEWIAELNQAAVEVDAERIFQLIEQIPPTHSVLAEKLTNLVRCFCFDEILDLIEGDL